MSSYKCPQCGLVNWNVAEMCKRCAAPNPYLAPASQQAFNAPVADVQAYQQQPVQQQPYQQQYAPQQQAFYGQPQQYSSGPDYNTPPPPNVYGAGAGANAGGYGYQQNPYPYQNRGYNSPDMVVPANVADEVEKAMKMIKHAKTAGYVWAGLLGAFSILFLVLGAVISGSAGASKPGAAPIAALMGFMVVFFLGFTALIGGMAYGISRKSMVCAVIFLIITGLGVLGSLMNFSDPDTGSKAFGQLGFAALMCFFAVRGVMGISTINKYKHQYPQIVSE